jgi:hypothetical protein
MSTAAVSGQSIFQELQSFYQNRQADVSQLGSALQSGDLSSAQQAFSELAALGQSGPFANSEPFSKNSRAQAFETIGQDLQSGDLAGAQAAFATLTSKQSNSTTAAESNPATLVNISITEPGSGAAATAGTTSTTSTPSIYQQLQAFRQQRLSDLVQLGQDLAAGNQTAAQQDVNTLTTLGQSGPSANGQVFQQADRAQDFQAIGTALQSGNLAGAESAFTTLAGTFNKNIQAELAISGYGATGAQPVGPTQAPVSTVPPPAPVSTVPPPVAQPVGPTQVGPASAGTSNVPEIVINLGGVSGTPASTESAAPEIVINLGQDNNSSTASPEEVTINFGGGSSGDTISINTSINTTQGNSSDQININLNQQSNSEFIVNLLNSNAISQTESASGNTLSISA